MGSPSYVFKVEQGLPAFRPSCKRTCTNDRPFIVSGDFRLQHTVIPEKDVLDAIGAAQTYTGTITEFTATADFRKGVVSHGFFIEVQDVLGKWASSRSPTILVTNCAGT
jgi:hypothetical protein